MGDLAGSRDRRRAGRSSDDLEGEEKSNDDTDDAR